MEAQEKDTRRPIPYIANFTPTGIMTIAWDRQMIPIEQPEKIPVSQVAVDPDLIVSFDTIESSKRGRRLSQQNEDEILLKDIEKD